MKEGISIKGKVVDKNGNPLSGARVSGYGKTVSAEQPKLLETGEATVGGCERQVYTNENGLFEIQGVGRSDFLFTCPGYKPRSDVSLIPGYTDEQTWTVVLEQISSDN